MSEPMNLPELFELAKRATPGPWELSPYDDDFSMLKFDAPAWWNMSSKTVKDCEREMASNVTLIQGTVNALPAIEEMVRELKGLEQTLREQADVLYGRKPVITCAIVPWTRAGVFRQTASELRAILEKVGVRL